MKDNIRLNRLDYLLRERLEKLLKERRRLKMELDIRADSELMSTVVIRMEYKEIGIRIDEIRQLIEIRLKDAE